MGRGQRGWLGQFCLQHCPGPGCSPRPILLPRAVRDADIGVTQSPPEQLLAAPLCTPRAASPEAPLNKSPQAKHYGSFLFPWPSPPLSLLRFSFASSLPCLIFPWKLELLLLSLCLPSPLLLSLCLCSLLLVLNIFHLYLPPALAHPHLPHSAQLAQLGTFQGPESSKSSWQGTQSREIQLSI